jgi:hypothetical protein
MIRRKPIMILVYSDMANLQSAKSTEKYATFSRRESRLFGKGPIYTHFPIDFMARLAAVKETVGAKLNIKPELYEVYYRKAPTEREYLLSLFYRIYYS